MPKIHGEEEGVRAIQALQKAIGLEESEELARKGWRNMTDADRENTMLAYAAVCGGREAVHQ